MILFCDTSALIKLYLLEEGTPQLLARVESAKVIAACRIAWAEAMAAFARRSREVPRDARLIDQARKQFQDQWPNFAVVEVTQSVVELAGEYADTFALRGYDSVQLAAGKVLAEQSGEVTHFACFDARLLKAAKVLGLVVDLPDKA